MDKSVHSIEKSSKTFTFNSRASYKPNGCQLFNFSIHRRLILIKLSARKIYAFCHTKYYHQSKKSSWNKFKMCQNNTKILMTLHKHYMRHALEFVVLFFFF